MLPWIITVKKRNRIARKQHKKANSCETFQDSGLNNLVFFLQDFFRSAYLHSLKASGLELASGFWGYSARREF